MNFSDFSTLIYAVIFFVLVGLFLTVLILWTRMKLVRRTPCKIHINDDESLTKEVRGGTTLLNALLTNDISIPSPCGGKATCLQCKVQVVEGGGDVLETDKAAFTPKELKEGFRLSCQCKVKNDLKLVIPSDLLEVKEFKGKVVSNENVATFIKELVVQIDPKDGFDYRSGAYLLFHIPQYKTNTSDWKETIELVYQPDWEKFNMFNKQIDFSSAEPETRAYSMGSYPAEGLTFKFDIRIATPPFVGGKLSNKPWGMGSSYLFSLKEGDEISLSGPYGESFMIDNDKELIFLIGGAGASFGRSHILHLFNTEKTKRKVTLWYGARSIKENIYQEEYEKLAEEFENFSYHLVLSEPTKEDIESGWPTKEQDPIRTNYLFKAFQLDQLDKMDEPDEKLYYVCGPPMHNISVMKLLDDYGVLRESIVLDDFGS